MNPTFLTDRYQLTMLAAYASAGMAQRRSVFELFVRKLPPSRRFMVSCGIGRALELLPHLRFSSEQLAYLEADPVLGPTLRNPEVRALFENFRFRGRIVAIPEGRIAFPFQPLVRVEGTLAEAQLVETLLLSMINHDTRVASKCARIAMAAQKRPCFEFGSRRTHEAAAVDAARAAYVAGFAGTSNEQAAMLYRIPVTGTMAHSFVLAHLADQGETGEAEAFRAFCRTFEVKSTCLVDTFDTLRGVELAIGSAADKLSGIRIDSGNLAELSHASRKKLDAAGLKESRIVLSDDLDEYRIDELVRAGVPVDAFGVGTMAVATPDAPTLGAVYKLVAIEDRAGRMVGVQKRSPNKQNLCGPKQVFRSLDGLSDTIAGASEQLPGVPLLVALYENERPILSADLLVSRARLQTDLAAAPEELRSLLPRTDTQYPCTISAHLTSIQEEASRTGRVVL